MTFASFCGRTALTNIDCLRVFDVFLAISPLSEIGCVESSATRRGARYRGGIDYGGGEGRLAVYVSRQTTRPALMRPARGGGGFSLPRTFSRPELDAGQN